MMTTIQPCRSMAFPGRSLAPLAASVALFLGKSPRFAGTVHRPWLGGASNQMPPLALFQENNLKNAADPYAHRTARRQWPRSRARARGAAAAITHFRKVWAAATATSFGR